MALTDIHFAGTHLFIIIAPLIAALIAPTLVRLQRQHRIVQQLVAPEHRVLLLYNFSWKRKIIQTVLTIIAFIALVIAFLQPSWYQEPTNLEQKGRDVVIALDISRSMLAQDCQHSRLAAAKQKILDLITTLSADRVCLIIFSGTALIQCPLTHDYDAFSLFLQEVDAETFSSGTTSLSAPLHKAIELFNRQQTNKNRLLILCTDGEDFSEELNEVAQQARDQALSIFVLGFGSPQGAPIPLYDQQGKRIGHQKNNHGSVVITQLNEPVLQQLAQTLGGLYLHATEDNHDINAIQTWLEQYEQQLLQLRQKDLLQPGYYYATGTAFICLLLAWLL